MLGNSNYLARWQDAAIPIYYDNTDIPTGWVARFNGFLGDMNTSYSGIDPSNAGETNYTPNCTDGAAQKGNFLGFCDANLGGAQCALIIFGDPCNQIADLQNCSGVLALGGSYAASNTHQYDGLTWNNAIYGYVIVNNGAPDCLDDTEFEQMMTHELTHVFRMDHLDIVAYPDQNMNPTCCNAINTKDMECMDYAYGGVLPVELTSFDAFLSGKQVKLSWVTQSEKDNANFTLQRSSDGLQFLPIQSIPGKNTLAGGSYTCTDQRPVPGVNYYLLSQTDWDGTTQNLGIKSVYLPPTELQLHIMPNQVTTQELRCRIDSPGPFEGTMEVVDLSGKILVATNITLEKGSAWLEQPLNGLLPGLYALRLRTTTQQWTARFTKI
jgi:hypothetical protein